MQTTTNLPNKPCPSNLFALAARLDVTTTACPPEPGSVINSRTFAVLRQEAEKLGTESPSQAGRNAAFHSRVSFSLETVRAAMFSRTLQRKLLAEEVIRPEF